MRLQYLIIEAFRNISRNILVVLGAILAVFFTLSLIMLTLILGEVVRINTEQWSDDVRVIVFLRDELSPDAISAMQGSIGEWDEVEDVFFFSRQEGFDEARRLFADNELLLERIEADPTIIPASLRIKPADAGDYGSILLRLQDMSGIEDISSAAPWVDGMIALREGLQFIFVLLALVLSGAAVILIANTIHMAIFARREEIGIMKLVGAGNWFVRTPFLLEGLFEGLVGGALAVGLVVGMQQVAVDRLVDLPAWVDIDIGAQFLLQNGVLVVAFGAIVGVVGSAIAVWRFLRV
jgi:cell division transport system permease protein